MHTLNLFYEEPDPDRWVRFDRYPRRLIRRLVRGKTKPGGVMMVALELMKGLEKLNIPYRFNNYKYANAHPNELIGVIGKPHLIFEKKFKNPILFGAGVFSHPIDCPDLFKKYPNVKKILVPGNWMADMFHLTYGNQVEAWPVGIDTEKWKPAKSGSENYDFLIYDKIRWEHDNFENTLIKPIANTLEKHDLSYLTIQYGHYDHNELAIKLSLCKAVIFLCEHETQGLAYQQILSTNRPILAFDRGGYWSDPFYFPNKVKFSPVSSVPYWDARCGIKFRSIEEFESRLEEFKIALHKGEFEPRIFIIENLTLEICAQKYYNIYTSLAE